MYKQIILPQDSYHKHFNYLYKMLKCDKNLKCPIAMYKVSKNEILGNVGPLIKHGLHWITFTILTFINENNRSSTCLYKIWSKFISFDMTKKGKSKIGNRFCKKNLNLGVLGMSPYVSNGVPQPCLDPTWIMYVFDTNLN